MADSFSDTLSHLESLLRQKVEEVASIKQTINSLCRVSGKPEPYPDASPEQLGGVATIRSDQFHGRPLATVMTEYMEMRRASNMSPPSVNEIYDALLKGGYVFNTKNEENSKRSLRASLSKNPKFYRLPGGEYGLREWYPNAPARGGADNEDDDTSVEDDG